MSQDNTQMLLRRSWAEAIQDKDSLGRLFYANLFRAAPETEVLFKNDMNAQGKKLIATLAFIIDSLDDESALLSAAGDLAVRHVDYAVTSDHYPAVGQALITTLKDLLGAKFDTETETAWLDTYGVLSGHMIKTAYG